MLGGVKPGEYSALEPERAGVTFEFVLRDSDGLPIVRDTLNRVDRLSAYQAVLIRVAHQTAKPKLLPIQYLGNKERGEDGTFRTLLGNQLAPREMHGRVEVTITAYY